MALTILSLNVRGIRDDAKRREIFNWLRAKKPSICMLQEVHCTENSNPFWKAEWGYEAFFSSFESNKAGVCILFQNNFNLQFYRSYIDPSGRFIICDIKADEKLLTLANIYAPNEDNPLFFQNFFEHLSEFNCDDIIIGGDFNLVLDIEKDKKGGLPKTQQNSLKIIKDFSENLNLLDPWRVLNPDEYRYTWRQRKPEIHCRLDFFLLSQSIFGSVNSVDISPGYKTDHSLVTLKLSLHTNQRGPGFWKLNTSFLLETYYVNLVKTTIKMVKDEYEGDNTVSPALLWDMIKLKVREKSLSYAANKKKNSNRRETEIEQRIASLEKELDSSPKTNLQKNVDITKQLNGLRSELEKNN